MLASNPSPKFCQDFTPNPLACQPLCVLQEDYLWFLTISGFFLGFIIWGRSPQWPTVTRFLGGSPEILEMNMRWDAIWCVLRHNFEKCYTCRIWMIFPIKLLIYCNNNNYFGGGAGHFWRGSFYTSNTLNYMVICRALLSHSHYKDELLL